MYRVHATSSVKFNALFVFLFRIVSVLMAFCLASKHHLDRVMLHIKPPEIHLRRQNGYIFIQTVFKSDLLPKLKLGTKSEPLSSCVFSSLWLAVVFSLWSVEVTYYTWFLVWQQCVNRVATKISYPMQIAHKYYRHTVVKLHHSTSPFKTKRIQIGLKTWNSLELSFLCIMDKLNELSIFISIT